MPAKIRLARHGRKRKPIYHIVVADSRAPRDGKLIEKIGLYNPTTNPATIDLDFDKALDWLLKGAQPTETAKSILSAQGVLLKKHLLGGVKKGALTEEQAEAKFQEWIKNKALQKEELKQGLKQSKDKERDERLAAEAKIKEERAKEIAKRQSELAAALRAEEQGDEEVAETEEAASPATEVVAEEAPAAKVEEPAAKEEAPKAEEEETKEEAAPEADAKAEEKPSAPEEAKGSNDEEEKAAE
jgi:small subunit ribosomal protein S16